MLGVRPALPTKVGERGEVVPVMPIRKGPPRPHRQKNKPWHLHCLYAALVARPVGKAEIASKLVASEAMNQEWGRLSRKYVWDEDHPRDWRDVRQEAKDGAFDVRLDHVCGFCAENNSDSEAAYRKYKG